MIRTQVQLPDEIYEQAKRVAKAREISLAELTRRGLEYILAVYSDERFARSAWEFPTPRNLGWKGLSEEALKSEAQRTTTEAAFAELAAVENSRPPRT
jgi:hypothetical protein